MKHVWAINPADNNRSFYKFLNLGVCFKNEWFGDKFALVSELVWERDRNSSEHVAMHLQKASEWQKRPEQSSRNHECCIRQLICYFSVSGIILHFMYAKCHKSRVSKYALWVSAR